MIPFSMRSTKGFRLNWIETRQVAKVVTDCTLGKSERTATIVNSVKDETFFFTIELHIRSDRSIDPVTSQLYLHFYD